MTKNDPAAVHRTLDNLWRGVTSFDLPLVRTCLADDFRYWMNTAVAGPEPLATSAEGIDLDQLLAFIEWEKQEGISVSIVDSRRQLTEDGVIQRDIAKVTRDGLRIEFSRCHVFQMVDARIRRWWEYYDSSAASGWNAVPAAIAVLAD
jgi:ketosteroid isomerase-like protein